MASSESLSPIPNILEVQQLSGMPQAVILDADAYSLLPAIPFEDRNKITGAECFVPTVHCSEVPLVAGGLERSSRKPWKTALRLVIAATSLTSVVGISSSTAFAKGPKPDVSTSGVECEFFWTELKGIRKKITNKPNVIYIYNSSDKKRKGNIYARNTNDNNLQKSGGYEVSNPSVGFSVRRTTVTHGTGYFPYDKGDGAYNQVKLSVKGFDGKVECDKIDDK